MITNRKMPEWKDFCREVRSGLKAQYPHLTTKELDCIIQENLIWLEDEYRAAVNNIRNRRNTILNEMRGRIAAAVYQLADEAGLED